MKLQRRYLAVDVGGTLAKLCYVTLKHGQQKITPHLQNLTIEMEEEQINFQHFKSDSIDDSIQYIKDNLADYDVIGLTGGGAYKYLEAFKALGKQVVQVGQFQSLLLGVQSIRELNIKNEFISVNGKEVISHSIDYDNFYPFLMVNVGSGVSMLKFHIDQGKVKCQRTGGTCLGGGFFLGLAQVLTGHHTFSQLLQMAESGDNTTVDIIPEDMKDIGKVMPQFSNESHGLNEAPVLISLGKMQPTSQQQDLTKGLFKMVAFNLAQLALMHSNIQQIDRVVFTGFFCRNNHLMIDCFEQAFRFFGKQQQYANKKHAYGLRHNGYLGALGTLHKIMNTP